MDYIWIYITTKDKQEAKKIAEEVVRLRLAACANILDNMTSLYWWEGKVQEDSETVLILKSRKSLMRKIIDQVKKMHSYTCPCIIALPIIEGNHDYLDWIGNETRESK